MPALGHVGEEAREPRARVVGRDRELALLQELLAGGMSAALVLSGGPGIGKTTLWEAGIAAARERGLRVLSARPSGAQASLAFAGLADLLDEVHAEELVGLPAPQRRALEVALLRAEPAGGPPEPRAIALGFLNALCGLAADGPLLVAVDDVQWLDAASEDALAFAVQRLEGREIRFLLAKRVVGLSALERSFEPGLQRVEVTPLSLGATRLLLSERLGLTLPRRVLRQVFDAARGNPLFALELGRTLVERGVPEIGEELLVPEAVEDLLGARVAGLPEPVRRLVLAVALSTDLRVSQLGAVSEPDALDEALDAGVLRVDGDRVRLVHPLLAAAALRRSRSVERRELHRELAGAFTDAGRRARHLALATPGTDREVAATVSAAAAAAAARGAAEDAVELSEHALRLTPEGTERSDRLLALAEYLEVAGEPQRVTDLLEPQVDSLPPGEARVRAQLLLSEGGAITHVDEHERHLDLALAESRADPALRALVLAKKATNTANSSVERIPEAEAWALEALPAAREAGPGVERLVLHGLAWARSLGGRPIDDVNERFHAASDDAFHLMNSLDRVEGLRLTWRGETEKARSLLTGLLALADERGELWSYLVVRLHVCELELRAGDWEAASRLLQEWGESSDRGLLFAPSYERCRALLAVGRGLPDEVERWVVPALAGSEATGARWQLLETLRARGTAALLAHEPERAVESLLAVFQHTEREGIEDPGAFPVAPDLVEALVELGRLGEALAVTQRVAELSAQQEHPWGVVTAQRSDALVRLAAEGYDEEAARELAEVAGAFERLGLPFDAARTRFVLGRAQRRRRKWAAARRSLGDAAEAFEELGSTGWAEEARSELARVGARRPGRAGELTPSERRVVELAADGLSNKEIARTLVVTVNTVEAHLSHAYAKLGVRSRTQLARRLSERP